MVAADEVHIARVLQLERQQQTHRLQTMAAPVNRPPTQRSSKFLAQHPGPTCMHEAASSAMPDQAAVLKRPAVVQLGMPCIQQLGPKSVM